MSVVTLSFQEEQKTKSPTNFIWQPKLMSRLNKVFKLPHMAGMGPDRASDTAYLTLNKKPLCVICQYYYPVSNYSEKDDETTYTVDILDSQYTDYIDSFVPDTPIKPYCKKLSQSSLIVLLTRLLDKGAKFTRIPDWFMYLNDHGYG